MEIPMTGAHLLGTTDEFRIPQPNRRCTGPGALTGHALAVCARSRGRFSSSRCDRLMLRQPSTCHPMPREDGCSSTAIDPSKHFDIAAWINPVVVVHR
jgi:hypothetical protein